MSLNESAAIGIPCSKCGEKTDQTIGWLKSNNQFTCRRGEVITVESEKLFEGLEAAQRQLKAALGSVTKL